MAIKVGTLQVDLISNTASFTGPLDKAGQQAKRTARDIQDGFNGMDLGEARGSLMVTGELIGVHLPRHVQALIATLPGLGPLLAAAFPLIAIVAVGEAIFKATEAAQKHREEMEKNKQAALDNVDAMTKHTESMQLNNLKMADQIALLEGRPAKNKLQEGLIEAKIAAGDLLKQLEKDNQEAIKLLEKMAVGSWGSALTGAPDTSKQTEDAKNKLDDLTKAQKAYLQAVQQGINDPDKLQPLIANVKTAAGEVEKLAKAWKDKTDAEVLDNSRTYQQKIHNDAPDPVFKKAEEDKHTDERAAQQQLFAIAQQSQMQVTAMETEQQDIRKKGKLEQMAADIQNLDKVYAATKQVTAAQTKEALAAYQVEFDQGKITAEQLADLKQQALDKEYQAEVAHLEKVKALEAGEPELVKHTNQQIAALKATHNAQILGDYAATLNKQKELEKEFTRILFAEQSKRVSGPDDQVALAIKNIDASNKAFLESLNAQRSAAKQHAEALEAIDAQGLQFKREMGLISEADYEAEMQTELNATYMTVRKELQAKRDATLQGTADRVKADAQLQALDDKYQKDSEKNEQQSLLRRANNFRQLSSTVTSSLDGWIRGTEKFSQAWNKLWTGMATTAIESLIQVGVQEVIGLAIHQTIADKKKLTDAKSAFHGAYAATSDIPIIGPVLAPVAGAAAFAAVMAFEKGGIVPQDAYALVHHNEMVLPAPIASFIVNAASQGSGNGGGQNHFVFAPTVHAVDAEGVDRMLTKHADTFHRHVKAHMRRLNYA